MACTVSDSLSSRFFFSGFSQKVERATLRVYAENNSTQSELAEQRAM